MANFTFISDAPTAPGPLLVTPPIAVPNNSIVIAGVASSSNSTYTANNSGTYAVSTTSDPDVVIYSILSTSQNTSPIVDISATATRMRVSGFVFAANTGGGGGGGGGSTSIKYLVESGITRGISRGIFRGTA
jgi:hypothetical protein